MYHLSLVQKCSLSEKSNRTMFIEKGVRGIFFMTIEIAKITNVTLQMSWPNSK